VLLKNKNIVVVGLQPLDSEIGSNSINIAHEFSKHNNVLYVNHPYDRKSLIKDKNQARVRTRINIIDGKEKHLIQVKTQLWNLNPRIKIESINGIPFTKVFRTFNWFNNFRIAKEIRSAINELEFKEFILFNDSDMFRSFHLKEMLNPKLSIYYTRDNMMSVPYWFKHGHKLEPELMAKSDLVCANSTYLAEVAQKYNSNSFYVGQGCDLSEFDSSKIFEKPIEFEDIKPPVIGYIGALYKLRLDIDLIEKIALSKKEWSFVLIGPEDDAFKNSKLHKMSNVFFFGLKPGNELPKFLKFFDVAINPQSLNPTTIGNYPRKIDEYLAMGKHVVATRTKAMEIFENHTYLAENVADYIKLLELALKEDNKKQQEDRINFSKSHTWENSVQMIYDSILKVKPQLFED